jgi:hypothetical protein
MLTHPEAAVHRLAGERLGEPGQDLLGDLLR